MLLAGLAVLTLAASGHGADVAGQARYPNPADIAKALDAANSYFINSQNGNPGDCGWTRATYFAGNMAQFAASKNATYLGWATKWAEGNDWACHNSTNANDECCGRSYIDMYLLDRQSYKLNLVHTLDTQLAQNTSVDWTWVDALFMALPTWSAFGNVTGNPAYWDKMWAEYRYTAYEIAGQGLWNQTAGLFFRDPTFFNASCPNGQKVFWGRGNGWAIAAMAGALQWLPAGHPQRVEYAGKMTAMAATLKGLQGSDGLWRSSLLDYDQFPNPESTSTGLFTHALAWGVNNGVLPRDEYVETIAAGWNGLATVALQPDGLVGWCQSPAGSPGPATQRSTSDFCVGQFLLAGTEVSKLFSGL